MSRMEHHVGKAVEVAVDHKGLKAKAEHIRDTQGISILDDFDEEPEWLEIISKEYVYSDVNDALYQLKDHTEDEYGVNRIDILPNGEIDFVLSFYNGGACFTEAFESALKKAKA